MHCVEWTTNAFVRYDCRSMHGDNNRLSRMNSVLDVANNSKRELWIDLLMLLERHRNYDLNNTLQ